VLRSWDLCYRIENIIASIDEAMDTDSMICLPHPVSSSE
jgi:hypothetical protein